MSRKRRERKKRQRAKRLEEAEIEVEPGDEEPDGDVDDPGMSEVEIRAAGMRIDLPFEAPPKREGPVIRYKSGKTLDDIHRERFPDFYKDEEDGAGS